MRREVFMRIRSLSVFAALALLYAAPRALAEGEAEVKAASSKVKNPTLREHLMNNIDIFGKTDMPAIYILAPGDAELEGAILTRDFSRDPFFMQNIDREEFELKMTLREFQEDEGKKVQAALP